MRWLPVLALWACAAAPADPTASADGAWRPRPTVPAVADAPAPPPAPAPSPSAANRPADHGPKVCGLAAPRTGAHDASLRALAVRLRLDHPDAFVSVANTVHDTGRLPDCYLTKAAAEAKGWGNGRALWDVAPGAAIGGDRFGNREGRLPAGGRYTEADLDYDGGSRGAHRLVFDAADAKDWALWVTTDHYGSFTRVEVP